MTDLPGLRVSDAEREAVVARLQRAAGEGRLTVEEPADLAFAARTDAELATVTADLPASTAAPRAEIAPADDKLDWVVAVMSGAERKGRRRARRRTSAVAIMGGVEIDLRDAVLTAPEIHITAVAVMGGIEIYVPEGVEVVSGGFAFMGASSSLRDGDPLPPGAPVVNVKAYSLMGAVDVKRKRLREIAADKVRGWIEPPPPPGG